MRALKFKSSQDAARINGHKGMKRKTKRTLFIVGMLAFPLLQWLVFFVYVNMDSIVMSFQTMNFKTGAMEWSLNNYKRFFYEWNALPQIKNAVKNSLLAGANNIVLLLISIVLSYFFYKKMPGRNFFRVVYFLPSIISIVVYTMVYKFMFDTSVGPINILLQNLGVSATDLPAWFGDTKLAFWLVLLYCLWVGTGYNILIIGAAMENLPKDVMEYSHMEGVSRTRELFQIVIPMIWPTISVAILGSVTIVFTLFIQVELLTQGGPGQSSQTIAYLVNGLIKGANADLEWGAAMGLCFTAVAAPIVVVMKKLLDKIGDHFGC